MSTIRASFKIGDLYGNVAINKNGHHFITFAGVTAPFPDWAFPVRTEASIAYSKTLSCSDQFYITKAEIK